MATLDVQFADLEEAESAVHEIDAIVGGLSPVPADTAGVALDEDAFDANILAAYICAR